ncbi:DUF4124 domain-containing protein [Polaromonas sp. UC242_47]|uniref:DUF4124 domain-containing protein n=1 Tax=Polaromonas sp. UC242_47 TaxID=3374626 RepID=UPI0037ACF726
MTKKPLLQPPAFVAQAGSATLESMDLKITPKHLVLTLAGWAIALSAAAQWQWIDKDGRKVFSDRPPPSDIKDKDILKQPGGRGRASVAVQPSEPGDAATPAAPVATAKEAAPKLSGKNAELEAKKKKLEEDEAAKKKAEDEKVALGKADNCERAKKAVATLQSGVRVSTTNAKGEREFMDDNTRAAENQRLQGIVDSDCK